ncbi:TetR/AcrR family transcriptional regulator [Streptomyces sp. NBC_00536]|uniref:TetR/AcrR family transcriptional regulator n=1 Tax=Streptomyces sp. NBC_00536 TaxID=2975769 RepID=UPI002E82452C|nr:TetR/AcrR family transcriptional regulator [Streptomyces sp. NBC_00536]WUC82220.1 TetR/AcrR family transcriptional regulator [Streptomyces sp. NBC_00536]
MAAAAQDDHPGTPASAPLPAAAPTSRSRTSAKGAQTRAKLIAAARTLLAGEGFARFSTRNVAALCGISHGMCHYHFQDRTDLIVAVVEDIRGEWITPMETAVDTPGSFAERAERVVVRLNRPEGPDLSRLHSALHWFALNDERVRAAVDAEYQRWLACFVRLFQVLSDEHGGAVDPVPLGTALAAAADGLAAIQSLDSRVETEAAVRALVSGLTAVAVRPF